MSKNNLKRVGNVDLTYNEALELMEQGKLVSQKNVMAKGVFAFKIPDLAIPVSLMLMDSGKTSAVKDYYKAKYPNLTSENNPIITAYGCFAVKREDDSMSPVSTEGLLAGNTDDNVWFEVEACTSEESEAVVEDETPIETEQNSVLKFSVGDEVVRTKGDYVVGRVGKIFAIDTIKMRAQVKWDGVPMTWVSFNALELTSIPYEILKKGTTYPKYRKLIA